MKNWFDEGEWGFTMFGFEHLLCMFMILFVSIGMYLFRKRLRNTASLKYVLFIGFVLSEVSYQWWAVHNKIWSVQLYLPLQLCSLNIYLCIILLLTENKKLFAFVYLFGFSGALQGLITPELFQKAWHFRFIQYFLAHGYIVWTAMYFAIVKQYRITWRRFFYSFVWLNVIALFVYVVNTLLGANYMFLMKKPSNPSIMDFMGPYPYYILVLEVVALILCMIVFFPVKEKKSLEEGHTFKA